MNTYQRSAIVVIAVFVALYVLVILFIPIHIGSDFILTVINGVTTSIGIIVGIGGATLGFVFRGDIEREDFRGRRAYFIALGLFLFALVYPWGSYIFLAWGIAGSDVFALRYSFGGYLLAMMTMLEIYILIGKRWNIERESNVENPPTESDDDEKQKSDVKTKENENSKNVNIFVNVS